MFNVGLFLINYCPTEAKSNKQEDSEKIGLIGLLKHN